MDEQQRLSVFQAQTENIRELHRAWKHINRQINDSLVGNNTTTVGVNTKILAIVYCALAEATFSKLIHTPHGLTLDEIEQIKKAIKLTGVKSGWTKCAELAVQRVDGAKHNHRPNVLQKLTAMIDEFIYDPSLIRNKLAHGQWCIALNVENTAVNEKLTAEISGYSVLDFYRWQHSLEQLAAIIEDLIESPNRAHRRDYWPSLSKLEAKQWEIADWTIEKKVAQLRTKKSRTTRTYVLHLGHSVR
jgi:hypothetical protein